MATKRKLKISEMVDEFVDADRAVKEAERLRDEKRKAILNLPRPNDNRYYGSAAYVEIKNYTQTRYNRAMLETHVKPDVLALCSTTTPCQRLDIKPLTDASK
jgi:hypothetical protein